MVDTATHDQLVAELTGGLAPSEDDLAPFEGSDRLRPDGRPRPEFRAELRRIPTWPTSFIFLWFWCTPSWWFGVR